MIPLEADAKAFIIFVLNDLVVVFNIMDQILASIPFHINCYMIFY